LHDSEEGEEPKGEPVSDFEVKQIVVNRIESVLYRKRILSNEVPEYEKEAGEPITGENVSSSSESGAFEQNDLAKAK
jgi:hypothetical protein